ARGILTAARSGELADTRQLAALVGRLLRDARPAAIAPVFQALRVWVNDEMADLEASLQWLPEVMADGGVVVTLSYHSGEDRRVKQALRGPRRAPSRRLPPAADESAPGPWKELTRKVVVASEQEQLTNPRARSARLRAFRREPR
ncbi:MAG TPA: 16S rRNA (cytosine(1402)-N(4))-methyltransferase, partial [Candidatus Eisenbacteria bacterium]